MRSRILQSALASRSRVWTLLLMGCVGVNAAGVYGNPCGPWCATFRLAATGQFDYYTFVSDVSYWMYNVDENNKRPQTVAEVTRTHYSWSNYACICGGGWNAFPCITGSNGWIQGVTQVDTPTQCLFND